MADERTDRHALPLLQAGQAQKEMTHNEALVMLDMLAMAVVEGVADIPPADPAPGECWIVGDGAGAGWAGQAGAIAGWTAAGWRFLAPHDGMRCWVSGRNVAAVRRDGAWRIGEVNATSLRIDGETVVGARQGPISGPEGGAYVDVEARAAVDAMLSALRTHGLIATA